MASATAGDPITGLKWTRKTTVRVSRELAKSGIDVCARTVARVLDDLDYSLRVNHKKLSTRGSARTRSQRDEQFLYIESLRESFVRKGLPVISVDTKKKELIGCFKNPGAAWGRVPTEVSDHDFRSQASAIAVPYGVFDIVANCGHVFVGTSYDTPAFAVASVARWWTTEGSIRYPAANRLLILADNGGSNGARCRAWKYELQGKLCDRHQVEVTVCHDPPGASNWNPIERRLFSHISRNWAAEPLVSLEKMLKFIRTTKTQAGLRVRATLVKTNYPKGMKPSAQQMADLNFVAHTTQPAWNYTMAPTC
ncbi:ISAzo13 family transposase [Myxococcota bacterium]